MTQRNKEERSVHAGGPGSSHQGGSHGEALRREKPPQPGEPTNSRRSAVSGGGGERDVHHTRSSDTKGGNAT